MNVIRSDQTLASQIAFNDRGYSYLPEDNDGVRRLCKMPWKTPFQSNLILESCALSISVLDLRSLFIFLFSAKILHLRTFVWYEFHSVYTSVPAHNSKDNIFNHSCKEIYSFIISRWRSPVSSTSWAVCRPISLPNYASLHMPNTSQWRSPSLLLPRTTTTTTMQRQTLLIHLSLLQ